MNDDFKRVGGALSIDFHNTASWVDGQVVGDEKLRSYADLVRWARSSEIVTARQSAALLDEAMAQPQRAKVVLAQALAFRAAIAALGSSLAAGQSPGAADVDAINRVLERVPVRLRRRGKRFELGGEGGDLGSVLWPVVWDWVSILQDDAALVSLKACAGDRCGWLFLDTSRRGNRRWCDMADCGNRAKVRRFHRRHGPHRRRAT